MVLIADGRVVISNTTVTDNNNFGISEMLAHFIKI